MLKSSYYTEPTELDRLVLAKLVPSDHYLRRVKAVLDFEAFRPKVADCYSPSMGRGAEDPVRLIKIHFLQFQYDLSDSKVLEQLQVNVAFRFFLDLSLESKLPTPGLLSQFRTRLGAERFQALFAEVVTQARAHKLVSDRVRLKDATHVIANIAVPATIQLLAQARQRLLARAEPFAPEAVAVHRQQAEAVRAASAPLKDEQRLVARVEHLRQIVSWAEALGSGVGADAGPAREALEEAIEQAHQVLRDREPGAKDRLRSFEDEDARQGKHGAYFDGYLLDISLDPSSELICAVEVLAANAEEALDATRLIEQEEAAQGNDVECVSIDGAGFRGDLLEALTAPGGPQVQVVVPVRSWSNTAEGCFEPEAFEVSADGLELECPAGQRTRVRRELKRSGVQFRFSPQQCATCPLRSRCLSAESRERSRRVVKNRYEAHYRAARAFAQTDRYQQIRSQHPAVERKLADIIRNHGGRRVRYRRLWRAKVQFYMTALVVNVKRMVKLLFPSPRPQSA